MVDVERLRIWDDPGETICADAADEIEKLRALLRDAPILVIDVKAAHARGEKEAVEYARLVVEWHPKAKAMLGAVEQNVREG